MRRRPGARPPAAAFLALSLIGALGPGPAALEAQAVGSASEAPARSPADVLQAAREAQGRFETDRVRYSPIEGDPGGGAACDARVGRLCYTRPTRGDWFPTPEDPRIVAAREALLDTLTLAARAVPGDPWVLAQRVVYAGEAGRWEEGEALARAACAVAEGDGVCRALQGLALHALGRFAEAEAAFRVALARMGGARAAEWTDPDELLDPAARAWWRRVPEAERAARGALVWSLADPLFLVPGNDALTELWARRTMAWARREARNGYAMRWGDDLRDLMLRYGWEVGWTRRPDRAAVGHQNPEARPFLPPGAVLRDPAASTRASWTLDERVARSAYGPAYAAAVLPADGELSVFPRGDRFVIVGAQRLPEDTTFHAEHDHPGRREARPPWRGQAPEDGLFLLPLDGGALRAVRSAADGGSGLLLEAPAGDYVASLESFAPAPRRAGRTRLGIHVPSRPPDLLTISDLMLIDRALPDGADLEDAAHAALPGAGIRAGERVAIAWELFGLGRSAESIAYRFSIERADGGLLRAAGRRLGLVGAPRERRLEWQEAAPDRPGPVLRSVEIEMPDASPGRYVVRLEVDVAGRATVTGTRTVEILRRPAQ